MIPMANVRNRRFHDSDLLTSLSQFKVVGLHLLNSITSVPNVATKDLSPGISQ